MNTIKNPNNPRRTIVQWVPGLFLAFVLIIIGVVTFATSPVVAQDDMSDPETCLMCHADMERDTENPRIHNPDGTIKQETHQMFACIDCHMDIEEIPHKEDVERGVDCLNCHETEPET